MSDKSTSELGSAWEAPGIADTPPEPIADNLDQQPTPAPYPKRIPPWSTPEARALRRLRRPFVRNYYRASNPLFGHVVDRAACWLLPWSVHNYPGRNRGLAQLLGFSVASASSHRAWIGRARLERLASEIERRSEIGLRLAAELRSEVERKRRVGRPRGLQIIGEDGMRKHQARRGRSKRRVVSAGPPAV